MQSSPTSTPSPQKLVCDYHPSVNTLRKTTLICSYSTPINLAENMYHISCLLYVCYRPDAPHWWCPRWTLGWQLTWLDPFQILPGRFDCFADTLRLHCPGAGAPCTSPPGVAVRPRPGFDSVMALAESGGQQSAVFGPLVGTLERLGWRRGVDILAHGYDWRCACLCVSLQHITLYKLAL
jgi:Lecithin:cholesterol acyltransferase